MGQWIWFNLGSRVENSRALSVGVNKIQIIHFPIADKVPSRNKGNVFKVPSRNKGIVFKEKEFWSIAKEKMSIPNTHNEQSRHQITILLEYYTSLKGLITPQYISVLVWKKYSIFGFPAFFLNFLVRSRAFYPLAFSSFPIFFYITPGSPDRKGDLTGPPGVGGHKKLG